ncbi:PspC domain-containing protein [Nocardioides limicola]|uniref:PspC domain-containing protein n=1 Tax=Nocardioides limicola TaxID=2803368 RepID=UPI00193C0E8C|nr:PspC domain-containing protein [Nocardioides sp. DJM-14]
MEETTPSSAPGQPAPSDRPNWGAARDFGPLRRSVADRKVAGVAAGVARHFNLDPTLVRVIFVVLAIFGGAGVLLYAAGWLLVPEEGSEQAAIDLEPQSRTVALWGAAGIGALMTVGGSWSFWAFPIPVLIIAGVVLLVMQAQRRRDGGARAGTVAGTPPGGTPPGGTPPGGTPPASWSGFAGPAPAGPPTSTGPTSPSTVGATVGWQPGPAGPVGPPYTGFIGQAPVASGPPVATATAPKRRGPVLFWPVAAFFTPLALVTLAALSSRIDIPSAAYPAAILALAGIGLVIGAFWGRAGGLIALGLVAALAMAAQSVGDHLDRVGPQTEIPASAEQIDERYELHVGVLEIDLRGVEDLAALDGRPIRAEVGIGQLRVILPDDIEPRLNASVGIGSVRAFGSDHGGFGQDVSQGSADSDVELILEVGIGQVEVLSESEHAQSRSERRRVDRQQREEERSNR